MQSTILKGKSLRGAMPQAAPASRRSPLVVECNKRVQKKAKIILTKNVTGVGQEGEIKQVPLGYWRNFLLPRKQAEIVSESIMMAIRNQKESELRAALEAKAQAQSFAQALGTIGKFIIRKKAGDRDQIYGSVQVSEIVDAIYQQTGRSLAKSPFTLPDIKALGTYECQVKLHPEVTATFSVVIQREKNVQGQKKR